MIVSGSGPSGILWMTLSFRHLHRKRRSSERDYVSMDELSSHVFKQWTTCCVRDVFEFSLVLSRDAWH